MTLKIRSYGSKPNQFLRHAQGVFPPSFIETEPGVLAQLSTQDLWQTTRRTDGKREIYGRQMKKHIYLVNNMHRALNLSMLGDQREFHLQCLCHHNIYYDDKACMAKFFEPVSSIRTRACNNCSMKVPNIKSVEGHQAIKYRGPVAWNKVHNAIKSTEKCEAFARQSLKRILPSFDDHPTQSPSWNPNAGLQLNYILVRHGGRQQQNTSWQHDSLARCKFLAQWRSQGNNVATSQCISHVMMQFPVIIDIMTRLWLILAIVVGVTVSEPNSSKSEVIINYILDLIQ